MPQPQGSPATVAVQYTGPPPIYQPSLNLSWSAGEVKHLPAALAQMLLADHSGLYQSWPQPPGQQKKT